MLESAADVVDALTACPQFRELLEKDLKSRNEVGFSLGEEGTVFHFREGSHSEMTFTFPSEEYVDEQRIVVHTHPSIDATMNDGVTMSDSDLALGSHYAVCAMVALSPKMFDMHWFGEAVLFDDSGAVADRTTFEVLGEGVRDGPSEERFVSDFDVRR